MNKVTSPFKIGQKVAFRTHHGRTGAGKIIRIENKGRGDWHTVESSDGSVTVLRTSQLVKA